MRKIAASLGVDCNICDWRHSAIRQPSIRSFVRYFGIMSNLQVAIQGAGHLTAALVEGFFRADITTISITIALRNAPSNSLGDFRRLEYSTIRRPLTPRNVRC